MCKVSKLRLAFFSADLVSIMRSYRAVVTFEIIPRSYHLDSSNLIATLYKISAKQEKETKGQFATAKHLFIGKVAKFG